VSAGQLIFQQLKDTAGVASRIAPDVHPPGDGLPAIVYQITTDEVMATLGASKSYKATIVATILGTLATDCKVVADAIITGVHGAAWTYGGETVQRALVTGSESGSLDNSEPGASDQKRFESVNITMFYTK